MFFLVGAIVVKGKANLVDVSKVNRIGLFSSSRFIFW